MVDPPGGDAFPAEATNGFSGPGASDDSASATGVVVPAGTSGEAEIHFAGLLHDLRNAVGFVTNSAGQLQRYFNDIVEMMLFFADLEGGLPEAERAMLAEFRELVQVDIAIQEVPGVLETLETGQKRILDILSELRPARAALNDGAPALADLVALVNRALTAFRTSWGSQVEFTAELESVPPVRCSPTELGRLLDNLLLNAVKAIDAEERDGAIRVRVRLGDEGLGVELEVSDNGVGMSADVKERVFEPYFTTRGKQGGTGLGLAVVKRVVDGCRGRLTLDTQPGVGSTFCIWLPVADGVEGGEGS